MNRNVILGLLTGAILLCGGCSREPAATGGGPVAPAVAPGPSANSLKVTLIAPSTRPRAGKQNLAFTVADSAGNPVRGATIDASVAMVSMDMGGTKQRVVEGQPGRYTAAVEFSMAGKWRVTLSIASSGQKPVTETLDFEVAN